MSIILKHLLRNISAKKGRSFMVLFSLIMTAFIGTLLFSIGDGMDDLVMGAIKGLLGDTQITVSAINPVRTSEIVIPEGMSAVHRIDKTVVRQFHQPSSFKYTTQRTLTLTGIDLQEAYQTGMTAKQYDIADQEIIMNQKAADELEYQVGDEVVVYNYLEEPVTLKIADVVSDNGTLLKSSPAFIANLKTVSRLYGDYDDLCNLVFVHVPDKKADLEALAAQIERDNAAVYATAEPIDLHGQMKMLTNTLILPFMSFVAVLLLMIYFVISNIANTIVAERIPVIGSFRSIGATGRMMYLMLIGENVLYGLIAGVIGALLGSVAFHALMNFMINVMNNVDMGSAGFSFSITEPIDTRPYVIVLVIILTTLLQVLFSLWSIFSIRKMSVKNLIFNKQDTSYIHSDRKLKAGIVLVVCGVIFYLVSLPFRKTVLIVLSMASMLCILTGVVLLVPHMMRLISYLFGKLADKRSNGVLTLAAANIRNNKMIMRTAVLATATISLTFLMYSYIDAQNRVGQKVPYHADLFINTTMAKWSDLSYIENINGVEDAFPIYQNLATKVLINGESDSITLMANNNADQMEKYTELFREMNWEQYQNLRADEVLMDEELMKSLKLQVGDTFVYEDDSTIAGQVKQKPITLHIAGAMDSRNVSDSRDVIIMCKPTYFKYSGGSSISMALIVTQEGKAQEVYELLKVRTSVQTYADYVKDDEKSNQQKEAVLYFFIGMVVLLSFISIFDNQMIGFSQRSRQFAVLYSTCTSKHQLKMTILCETALTFVGVLLFALMDSIVLLEPFERLILGTGSTMDMYPSIGMLGLAVVIFFIVMLTTKSPVKHINHMNVVEEIKYE
ncbi:MAG: ABC transporter permease [bacterium]|nr:ABC transporter permease [bacterium]